MPHARVDDISIFYKETGHGPPVIFAHAYLGRTDVWAGQRLALAGRYRVIAYDARGHGRTGSPDDRDAYSLSRAIDDVVGLMDALDIERAHVCGLSMGAETMLHLLLRHPDRVQTATLADIGTGSDDPEAFRAYCSDLAGSCLDRGTSWTFEHRLTRDEFVLGLSRKREKAMDGLRVLVESQDPKGLAYCLYGVISDRPRIYSLESELGAVDRPVLVITGALDATVTGPAAFLARTIPGAVAVVIPDVGHVTNIQAPGPFNRALLTFLDSHRTEPEEPPG